MFGVIEWSMVTFKPVMKMVVVYWMWELSQSGFKTGKVGLLVPRLIGIPALFIQVSCFKIGQCTRVAVV